MNPKTKQLVLYRMAEGCVAFYMGNLKKPDKTTEDILKALKNTLSKPDDDSGCMSLTTFALGYQMGKYGLSEYEDCSDPEEQPTKQEVFDLVEEKFNYLRDCVEFNWEAEVIPKTLH